MNVERVLDLLLWLAGAGHFVVLIASLQVPGRLGWKTDLAKLTRMNRKYVWVQGSFTVLTIMAFGALMLVLHAEFLAGERSAVALAGFIATYWTARVLVDAFYFSHSDWPRGRFFVIGHIFLTSLFVFLAATNWAVVYKHAW